MKLHSADVAWVVLAAGVVAYEFGAPRGELLYEGVDRYLHRPWVTRAAVGITAAHLLNLIPRQVDPFQQVAALFGR
jgi:hypothetical protein